MEPTQSRKALPFAKIECMAVGLHGGRTTRNHGQHDTLPTVPLAECAVQPRHEIGSFLIGVVAWLGKFVQAVKD